MNFQFFIEKLNDSDTYKKFIEENSKALPASAFFVLDFENPKNPDNKSHFDFLIPEENKMFSCQLEEGCKFVPVEKFAENIKPISLGHEFDFDEVKSLVLEEMKKRDIKNKLQRILLSLQNKDGVDYLVGTVFLSQLGLLKVNINLKEMKITDFEKKSFMDMLKVTGKGKAE